MKRQVKTAGAALARTVRPVSDGLENVAAGLGTNRDKRSYSQYSLNTAMNRLELENMFRSSWLAGKIVNVPAEDMTREWRQIKFDGSEESDTLELAEKRLNVRAKFTDAIRWARLYGGSCIVLGVANGELSQPLDPKTVNAGQLKYLHVIDRHRISGGPILTSNLESSNFGLPEHYLIAESAVVVHHSRILRFDGYKLPYFAWEQNERWHDSELQHVVDSLKNADTATAAIASMLFEANVDVIKSKGLADLLSTKDGEAKVIKRFQSGAMLKSFNHMLLLDGDEEYDKKSNNFANLDAIITRFFQDVSGACDIPMTRLFGQSAGGLNATGDNDIRNYYDMISAKQEATLRPQLERFDEVFVRSELGAVPQGYEFEFNSLWQMSDKEKADIEMVRANRDKVYLELGVITDGVIAGDLKEVGTYSTMTDEDVELAKGLSKPVDEPPDDELPGQGSAKPEPIGQANE